MRGQWVDTGSVGEQHSKHRKEHVQQHVARGGRAGSGTAGGALGNAAWDVWRLEYLFSAHRGIRDAYVGACVYIYGR